MKRNALIGIMGIIWAAVSVVQVINNDIKSAVLYGIIAAVFFIALIFKRANKK